jgi:hypothetical protein
MLQSLNRLALLKAGACVSILASTGSLFAQWGVNAQPCFDGRCAPSRKTWGFYETHWQRWPNAVYPDMIGPPAKRGADQIQPSEIELPSPNVEAEVQVPSATRGPTRINPPAGGSTELPNDFPGRREAMPRETLPIPTDNSELRRPANAAPIEEPQFGVPMNPEPTPAAPPRSSGLPKPRVRPGSPTAPVALSPAISELRGQRVSWTETQENRNGTQAVIHPSASAFKAMSPTDEPDLIVPSLNSRPINMKISDPRTTGPKVPEARASEVRPAEFRAPETRAMESRALEIQPPELRVNRPTGNPLREDAGLESPMGGSEIPQTSFGIRSDGAGTTSNAARGNPLRRN